MTLRYRGFMPSERKKWQEYQSVRNAADLEVFFARYPGAKAYIAKMVAVGRTSRRDPAWYAERNRRIVAARRAGATLRAIGDREGLSSERVRMIVNRANR